MSRSLPALGLLCVIGLILLTGCATTPSTEPAPLPSAVTRNELPAAWRPLSPSDRPSTSAGIYLGNLDSRIAVLSARSDATSHGLLAGLLLQRHRILGRIADAESARDLLIERDDLDASALATLAATHMVFHDFAAADAALDRAEAIDASEPGIAVLRRDLAVARGDRAFLLRDIGTAAQPVADVHELAHRADLLVNLGQLDLAMIWYRTAQDLHADVDPFMLAWLQTQQGIALLRHERIAEARIYFETAHARLPQYYLAAEHLAECEMLLGHHDRARVLLNSVIAQTGNPEFIAMRAELEARAGNAPAADAARAEAIAAYEALLARHPAAYAAHAAEFFLELGEIERARELAQANLQLRTDWPSELLVAEVALAAGEDGTACKHLRLAALSPLSPPEVARFRERLAAEGHQCP